MLSYQQAVATSSCGVFFNGAKIGSPNNAPATMPPANWIEILLELLKFLDSDAIKKIFNFTYNYEHGREPTCKRMFSAESVRACSKIFFNRQSTQHRVCNVEPRIHFQFYHLISDIEKAFGIHFFVFQSITQR